jgi:hypothetical protein
MLELNFDELLEKITSKGVAKAGTGGGATQVTQIIANLRILMDAARKVDIKKLPFRPTVKQIAIALGIPETKAPQFFYGLSERVREALPEDIQLEKEEKKYSIIVELPAETTTEPV